MSGLNELAVQCEKRGWRLLVNGHYPDGRYQEGFVADALEVRDRDRELLAHVTFDPLTPDTAAVAAAQALHAQGLIA